MTESSFFEDPGFDPDAFSEFREAILREPKLGFELGLDELTDNQMIYVASVDLQEITAEEQHLLEDQEKLRLKNKETTEKRNQGINSLKYRASARLLSQHRDRSTKIKGHGKVQAKQFGDRAKKVRKGFKEAKKELNSIVSLKKRYAKLHIGKLKEKPDAEIINMFKKSKKLHIRVELCRSVKDKLPSASYVILVSLWDRLGGTKLEYSKHHRITKPVMHGGRYFNNALRFEETLELDIPAPDKLSSSMAIGFELFLLKNRNVKFDKAVAYSYFPLINSDFNISEGRFKTTMMKGAIDLSVEKYSDMEVKYRKNIDDWLCNLYFSTKVEDPPETIQLKLPEQYEQYQFSVTGPDGLKGRWEGWKRFKYIVSEVFQDLGFKLKKSSYNQIWMSLVILLFCLWMCRLTHYFGQWAFFRALGVDINEFAVFWVTFTLKYASDLYFGTILGFIIAGTFFSWLVFLVFILVTFLCYWYANYFPSIGYRIGALYGVAIVVDPLITLIESVIRCPLEDDWDMDPFLMSIYFKDNASSDFYGPVVTFLIYTVIFILSSILVNFYLIYIHMNARILDTYNRINSLESAFFVPLDQEVGERYLRWVVKKAHSYKTIEGDTRKVAAVEYSERIQNKSYWHITIYNVGKRRSLYRHFMRLPEGTLMELSTNRLNMFADED